MCNNPAGWEDVIVGSIVGGCIGLFGGVSIGLWVTYGSKWEWAWFVGGLVGLLIGGSVGQAIEVGAKNAADAARRDQQDREQAERQRLTDAARRENDRRDATLGIVQSAETAVSAYEAMPKALTDVRTQLQAAKHFRSDGAYSPFWSAVEQAYAALSTYRQCADVIAQSATRYAEQVERLTSAGGSAQGLAELAVTPTPARRPPLPRPPAGRARPRPSGAGRRPR